VSSLTVQSGAASSYVTSSTTYGYTYDEMGNITQITKGGVVQQRYEYDDLGQLVREDDRASGNTYVYSYDNAGNLLAKKRYDFTTGTLGTLRFTYSYGYDDSAWGDLLTSYHLESIEYDAIGNPIRIGIYNAEEDFWQSGYELVRSCYAHVFGNAACGGFCGARHDKLFCQKKIGITQGDAYLFWRKRSIASHVHNTIRRIQQLLTNSGYFISCIAIDNFYFYVVAKTIIFPML
jgi:YD repeat-containing protein